MTSSCLEALVRLNTRGAHEGLANETVACCRVVIVATVTFLSLNAAIFNSKDIHQSVEVKRRRQIGEVVCVGNWKWSLANRTFDCCLELRSCDVSQFVETL